MARHAASKDAQGGKLDRYEGIVLVVDLLLEFIGRIHAVVAVFKEKMAVQRLFSNVEEVVILSLPP